MRILQLIPSLASGGAERFVVDLSNKLVELGHEVLLCTLNDNSNIDFNKQFLNPDVSYCSLQIKGRRFIDILTQTYRFVKEYKPDVIHCHLAILQYLLFVYVDRKIKVCHTIHNMPKYASGNGYFYKLLFKLLYATGRVIPVTIAEECHNAFSTYYGLNNDILIENGVTAISSTINMKVVTEEIDSYKFSPCTPVFIHVARFHEQKNQRLLIDVFNRLYINKKECVLLIIGRGFDDGEGASLRDSACCNIHFLGEKSNVSDYLLCSDFFCLTSIYEGLPISLIEAMSAGLTPICTAVGGVKNVIIDGETGYLCNKITTEAYYDAILFAMNNKISPSSIIKYYEHYFSMIRCVNRYVELFENTI